VFYDLLSKRIPFVLRERLNVPNISNFDKIFASCWLDEDNVLFATKDNQLVHWDIEKRTQSPITLPGNPETVPPESCGIHFINKSLDGELIVTGGINPNNIAIFQSSSLNSAVMSLHGHDDWVFAAEFLSKELLISAGRDSLVKLWNISMEDNLVSIRNPLVSRKEHERKIRDLKFNHKTKIFATVSSDNFVKFWDISNLDVIGSKFLEGANELVCMSVDEESNLFAVGTQHEAFLIDPKSCSIVRSIPSKDEDWGIRSINFSKNMLSLGGGLGRLSFFDLQADKFLFLEKQEWIETGLGWLHRDNSYFIHFGGTVNPNAVYTHTYSPCGTKLFVGGGPLMVGLKGSYGAIWY